jgi:dTDP-4-dehydrorhamnose 3,5-epimerase
MGLGHGFRALPDSTTIHYLCSTPYNPQREHAVNPNDADLGIDWGVETGWGKHPPVKRPSTRRDG